MEEGELDRRYKAKNGDICQISVGNMTFLLMAAFKSTKRTDERLSYQVWSYLCYNSTS